MKDAIIGFIIVFFALFLYLATLRGILGNPIATDVKNNLDQAAKPLELSPERGRYLLTMSLAEDRSFSLNQTLADAAYPDIGWYEGKFYIFFAPGISLLALPLYLVGAQYNLAQVAAFFTISLFASMTLFLLYKIGRTILQLPVWAAAIAPLIFGFASSSWSYAITLYQHHVTTFTLILILFSVWKFSQKKRFSWLWGIPVWSAAALAIAVDYPNIALIFPVMVYFLVSAFELQEKKSGYRISFRISAVLTGLIFVAFVVVQAYFNLTHFGGITRVSNTIPSYKSIVEDTQATQLTEDEISASIEDSRNAVEFFSETAMPFGFNTLTTSRDRGIFLYAPVFILSLFGMWSLRKRFAAPILAMYGTIFITFFLYSSWGDPWGGWAFGPRYLIPAMSILSLFAAHWVAQPKGQIIRRIVACMLIIPSSAIALLGALTTNAVPPKVEADFLKTKYNFLLNLDFLMDNKSGSFVYNTFFSQHITLVEYFWLILLVLIVAYYFLLFIAPFIRLFNTSNSS